MNLDASRPSKLLQLLAVLVRRPGEFAQRIASVVEYHFDQWVQQPPLYSTTAWSSTLSGLDRSLSSRLEAALTEPELQNIEGYVRQGIQKMSGGAPFGPFHNGDFLLARLCYALARVTQPENLVETGVCYGVTSSFLLQAIAVNGRGVLHSIDLPPLGRHGDRYVGSLIPAHLRNHWKLYRGLSMDLLPKVLPAIRTVGLFVHDSLHTARNIRRELEAITPYLVSSAAVIVDDVEGNDAFQKWVSVASPSFSTVLEEQNKASLLGLAVMGAKSDFRPPQSHCTGNEFLLENLGTRRTEV